ncbi:acetyltransferase [Vibrio cholerae]|nr:acetyltransferase [Vibrio cholerae]
MVSVVVFEFSVMRCQPLRRALCSNLLNFETCFFNGEFI